MADDVSGLVGGMVRWFTESQTNEPLFISYMYTRFTFTPPRTKFKSTLLDTIGKCVGGSFLSKGRRTLPVIQLPTVYYLHKQTSKFHRRWATFVQGRHDWLAGLCRCCWRRWVIFVKVTDQRERICGRPATAIWTEKGLKRIKKFPEKHRIVKSRDHRVKNHGHL